MAVNAADYFKSFPKLSQSEVTAAADHFNALEDNGKINENAIIRLFGELGQTISVAQAKKDI